jgi:hypothetical protein
MKYLKIAFAVLAMIFCIGCKQYETDKETQKSFKGDIVVTNEDGSNFTDRNIRVSISESLETKDTYDMLLKGVKFAEKMPVRIKMTIPGLKVENGKISGENIVPWAMGGPFAEWTIKKINGTISYDSNGEYSALDFDMVCAEYPVKFKGLYIEE